MSKDKEKATFFATNLEVNLATTYIGDALIKISNGLWWGNEFDLAIAGEKLKKAIKALEVARTKAKKAENKSKG